MEKIIFKTVSNNKCTFEPRYLQRSEGSAFAQYKYKHLGLPLQVIFFINKIIRTYWVLHYSAPGGVEELVGEVSLWLVELVEVGVGGVVVGPEKNITGIY